MTPAATVLFGDFRIDLADERLWRGPEALPLSPKAFAVLDHLLAHAGQLVTEQELFEAVWPDTAVGDSVLTVAIGELRRALGDDPRAPRFIATVHRRGYRFPRQRSGLRAPAPPPRDLRGRTTARGPSSWPETSQTPASTSGPRRARRAALRAPRACLVRGRPERATGADRLRDRREPGIGKTALVDRRSRPAVLAGVERAAGSDDGQCIEHYGAGEAYLPVLEVLGQLCKEPDGAELIALLARQAPTWVVQMPWLITGAELETVQRRVMGATRERMLREMAEALAAWTAERPATSWCWKICTGVIMPPWTCSPGWLGGRSRPASWCSARIDRRMSWRESIRSPQ